MNIPSEDMHYFNAISVDDIGEVFEWQGRIFRGILPKSESIVRGYFDSGFLNEIVNDKLFPETWITDYTNDRYCLILEHQKVWPSLSDAEWSFNMLKDAALMVIKIAIIAKRYSYDMKDCHSKNVLFHNNHPMFIDLGTFVPRKKGNDGWKTYLGFKQSYEFVLYMWSVGCCKMAKQQQTVALINTEEVYFLKYPHWLVNIKLLLSYLKLKRIALDMVCKSYDTIFEKKKHVKLQCLLKRIFSVVKPFKCQHLVSLYNKIEKLQVQKSYSNYYIDGESIKLSQEVKYELLSFKTALVLNTSANHLVEELSILPNLKNMVLVDSNEKKGNSSYLYYKEKSHGVNKVTNAVYDFCYPHVRWIEYKLPEERLRAELFVLNNPFEVEKDVCRAISLVFKVISLYKPKMLMVVESLSNVTIKKEDYCKYFDKYKVFEQNNEKITLLKLSNKNER